jgi:hypothetical protein
MKHLESALVWGVLLIVGGVLLLLQSLGVLVQLTGLIWAAIFGVGGLIFIALFLQNSQVRWWSAIPGFALLGLAAVVATQGLSQSLAGWGGSIFLGALSLAFWAIYIVNRPLWWAIIPGGVLLTLAVVALIDTLFPTVDAGTIFFLGMGLTFLLVYILPNPTGQMRWAIIPAAVMLVLAVIVGMESYRSFQYLWPVVLIIVGGYMVFRYARKTPSE